jgi:hypothetical protein
MIGYEIKTVVDQERQLRRLEAERYQMREPEIALAMQQLREVRAEMPKRSGVTRRLAVALQLAR